MTSKRPRAAGDSPPLRARAEASLSPKEREIAGSDVERLVYELRVHEVELTMQNEELRRTQLALEESRDRYQELYDLAPVAYFALAADGRIVEANLKAATLLGIDRKHLVGKRLSRFMSSADADRLHRHRLAVVDGGSAHGFDLELLTHDGRHVPVHLDAVATAREAGAPVVRCVIIDLSEIRRAEEGIRAHEARSKTVFDAVADAIVTCDASGRVETLNRAAEDLFGYAEHEARGTRIATLVPDLVPGSPSFAGRGREMTAKRRGGAAVPVLVGVGEWVDRAERKLAVILHDLTESRAASRRLRESEERFRQIAENTEDLFYVHERSGVIAYVSPAYERIWGRPPERGSALRDAWIEAIHPDDRPRVVEAYRALLRGDGFDQEYRIVRPDGELRVVHDRLFPVRTEAGAVTRDVGVVEDVTARRELEAELRHAQKMEAVGALASGAAHDFGNVLQVIVSLAAYAALEATPIERAREAMKKITGVAKRGGELASQLMSFARKRPAEPAPLEIDAAVNDTARLIARLLTERVRLEVRTRAPRRRVVADAGQIEQLLMNLAVNARDAMPDGGTLTIETEATTLSDAEIARRELRAADGYVRLVVRDTGAGMDEATRRRAFEPFFTTKEAGRGTGLGLPNVRGVARALGGDVEIETAPGAGTSVILLLPECAEIAPATPRSVAPSSGLRGKVLYVEDDPDVRASVRADLEALGLEVVEAASGEEAERAFDACDGRVDALVSDVLLPGMTGPKLADRVRRRRPELPVLFVSATQELVGAERDLQRGPQREGGAREIVLRKPFGRDDLAAALARLMRTGGARGEQRGD